MPKMPRTEESIFTEALDKRSPEELAAFLDGACGPDAALRARVENLLKSHEHAGSFLRKPVAATVDEPGPERPGMVIGPYKLMEQIGEGGMGLVFVAEQQQPVRRRVALKVIKPGMDSRQVIARFEAERQALALMDHQNIAKVLDAGTTESGRPYFVMELVQGVPITDYCDANQLTPRRRLELFVPVCHAVQHAHQKGIIHRDLKPSNVLVTMYDDQPVPKVIDFGVAKAIEQRLTDKTVYTQFGTLVGTFEYMSPEQAEMNAFGVDTRSDIYSLGVLLYELLTGTTPLERPRLRQAAFDEIRRIIKEEEPQRPSVRLSTSGALAKVAAARKTDPAKLSRLVRGELDWVVMRCLEKDRTRRYDTASGLARDVERYLRDEPVEACPPTLGYRLWKARKFWAAFAVVLLIVGILKGVTLFSIWQMSRATIAEQVAATERDEAVAAREIAAKERDKANAALDQLQRAQEERQAGQYVWDMRLLPLALEAGNVAEVNRLLARHLPQPGPTDRRRFEWYYWDRQLHADLRTDRLCDVGEPGGMWAASPDGSRVARLIPPDVAGDPAARAADSLILTVWDVSMRKVVLSRQLPVTRPAGQPFDVVKPIVPKFSADGKRLLVGWDGEPRTPGFHPGVPVRPRQVLEVATGKVLLELNSNPPRSPLRNHTEVAFSPDSRRFAAITALPGNSTPSSRGRAQVWDLDTGKEVCAPLDANDLAESPFSPNGARLIAVRLAGGIVRISVWDLARGAELAWWAMPQGTVLQALTCSPDGARVAGVTGERPPRVEGLISHIEPRGVTLWEIPSGKELHTLPLARPAGAGTAWLRVFFSPEGSRLAVERLPSDYRSGAAGSDLTLWDPLAGKPLPALTGFVDSSAARTTTGPTFSPDGRQLVSTDVNVLRSWDTETGKPLLTLRGHVNPIGLRAFSPDGKRLWSLELSGLLKEWDARPREPVAIPLVGRPDAPGGWAFAVSPDVRRVAMLVDVRSEQATTPGVQVWDAEGKKVTLLVPPPRAAAPREHPNPDRFSCSLTLSHDGRRVILIRSDVGRRETDLATLRPPDLTAWEVETGAVLLHQELDGRHRPSPPIWLDGSTVAILTRPTGDGAAPTVRVFDVISRQERPSLPLPGAQAAAGISFSPNGRRVAALAADNDGGATVKLVVWDVGSGERLSAVALEGGGRGPTDFSARIAWSPDGSRFAFRGGPWNNAVVTVHDAAMGKPLVTMEQSLTGDEGSGSIPCVAWSPDGSRIAAYVTGRTGGPPAVVKVWGAAHGKELLTLRPAVTGDASGPRQLAFTEDGHRLLLCDLVTDSAETLSLGGSRRQSLHLTTWDATPPSEREGKKP
jgi:serine/threonine protein kinase/WD40 repeat protein